MNQAGLVILLPPRPTEPCVATAHRLALELSAPVQLRRGRTVSQVFREGAQGVVTVSAERVSYVDAPGAEPFIFHPGLAKNRIGTILRGEPDTLVRAAGLVEGDRFLDTTLGKATDALVAAHVVGDKGRVVGIEVNPVMAALVRLGLETFRPPGKALQAAMGRIEVRHADHVEALRDMADGSFEVVYFDPFFSEQVRGAVDMSVLRRIGSHAEVSEEALAEAKRVAARRVLHKVRVDRDPPPAIADWQLVRGKRRIGYRVWERSRSR